MSDKLPRGWVVVQLRECADVLDSKRVPVNSEERAKRLGTTPYYGATGQVGYIDDFLFDEELLLLGEDGAPFFDKSKPIGYVITGKSWVNNHAHVLRAKSGITSNGYLKYFLDWFDFRDHVNGTTRLKLTQAAMNRIPVRIAPVNEQRRIVAKLEKILVKANACQKRLERIPVLLKRFRQSILAAACSGRLSADWRSENHVEEECQRHKLSAVGTVTGGITKNAKRQSLSLQVPYLRVANVYENRLELDEVKRIGVTDQEFERAQLKKGDILFVEGNGSVDQIGRVAVWDGSIEPCAHQNHLIKFRAGQHVVPRYVLYQMMAADGRAQLIEKATSSAGLHTLSISKISDVMLLVPSVAEQQEVVRRVDDLFSFADQIEARYIKAKAHVDKLTQSVLAKAFRGELVPQNPKDEPASVLLERIRSEAASKDTPLKPHSRRAA